MGQIGPIREGEAKTPHGAAHMGWPPHVWGATWVAPTWGRRTPGEVLPQVAPPPPLGL